MREEEAAEFAGADAAQPPSSLCSFPCGKTGLSEGSSELDVAAVSCLVMELISAGTLGHINLTSLKLAFMSNCTWLQQDTGL